MIHELLKDLDACDPAQEWAKDYATIEEIIESCHRGDWIGWLAEEMKLDKRLLVLSGALCAKTVIALMKDDRSIKAVEVAELYGRGLASDDELAATASDAAAAAYSAAWVARAAADAYAAYAADSAAFTAANAADADTAAAAAYAAYAADSAAFTAANAADSDAFTAANAAYAYTKNQKQTADIMRETLGKELIEAVNLRLKS